MNKHTRSVSLIDGHTEEMTDAEIKKALEDYRNSPIIFTKKGIISIGDIIDLINRQQAEIEELKTLCDMQDKIMLEQKVILEAINDEFNPLPFETDFDKAIKNAKTEAIKEFAERLKATLNPDCSYDLRKRIDNLVKEMTEKGGAE